MKLNKKNFLFALLSYTSFTIAWAQTTREWNIPKEAKQESQVGREASYTARQPVRISKNVTYKKTPNIFADDLDLDNARRLRANEKTAELIGQIEVLIKREDQKRRLGELKMRLAELYFDQSQIIAARESREWNERLSRWEKLSQEEKAKTSRPVLNTPKADSFRKKSLSLYLNLEKESRGADQGRSLMIRRDDVLFYLASTYMDLGQRKSAIPHFFELTRKFPQSPKAFQARLNLADLYFESGSYPKALPEYLLVVKESEKSDLEGAPDLRIYALYKAAWCYFNLQNYDKSIQAFKRTIEESSNSKSDKKIVFEQEALGDLTRAFAMGGKYNEGEQYYKSLGNKELLQTYQQTAAQIAKDKGHYRVAQYFFGALIRTNPEAPAARDMSLEQAEMIRKYGNLNDYAKALDDIFKNYGADSRWLSRQKGTKEEKSLLIAELVDLARREAKNLHNLAQKRKGDSLYIASLPLYEVYFKNVPDPNVDSTENVHEMRFYHAELLYKIGRFPEAAEAYTKVGEGKYETLSAYNQILAYREASKKDKKYAKQMIAVTEDFVTKYPNDKRAGDLLYAGAYEAFQSGSYDDALGTLQDVVKKFPGTPKGVEAAERILFIHEKNKQLDKVVSTAEEYKNNKDLMMAGGAAFGAKLTGILNNARFKRIEMMPESSSSELVKKAEAFLEEANSLPIDLKEKALNNANVYAQKSGNKDLEKRTSAALLAAFPKSSFAKNLYLKDADEAIMLGQFREAQTRYQKFLTTYKEEGTTKETAEWNILYIQTHLENVVLKEFRPRHTPSKTLISKAQEHLNKYPRSKNRSFLINLLAFRNGATSRDIANLRSIKGLSSRERSSLDEAEIVIAARNGRRTDLDSIVKRVSPQRANTVLLKEALAGAKFNLTEPAYASYAKLRLDFNPTRFATTLKRKLNALESLEKEYLQVVAYGNGEFALKSLQRISSLYRDFATEIGRSEDKEAKQVLEDNYAKPLREKGMTLLRRCFEKAVEFKIAGSGLAACNNDLATVKPDELILRDYILGMPRWFPEDNQNHDRPMMQVLADAFAKNNEGVFLLAVDMMESANPSKTPREAAYIDNMSALLEWKMGIGQAAEATFIRLSNEDGSDMRNIRDASMKNLSALRLQVGDIEGAWSILSGMNSNDFQVAEMKGLALAGRKKFSEAVEEFTNAIKKNEQNAAAYFNRALAYSESGDRAKAVSSMQAYIDRFQPPMNHISRKYMNGWSR